VAGALIGLLFVALSIHLNVLTRTRHADLRWDAWSILVVYATALVASLLPLIPQTLDALGYEVLALLVAQSGLSAFVWPRMLRSMTGMYSRAEIVMRLVRQTVAALAGVAAALALIAHQPWGIYAVAGLVIFLIVLAISRTWDIVFRAARAEDVA
jgi:hypothetical protein